MAYAEAGFSLKILKINRNIIKLDDVHFGDAFIDILYLG